MKQLLQEGTVIDSNFIEQNNPEKLVLKYRQEIGYKAQQLYKAFIVNCTGSIEIVVSVISK